MNFRSLRAEARGWLVGAGVLLILAALACGSSGESTPETVVGTSTTSPSATTNFSPPDLTAVPRVDTSLHSVPLDTVIFDTFDGSFERLSQTSDETIERLRDAILPIYNPGYSGPDGLDWLKDTDLVIGYESGSEAYAYPIKVLDRHELVNDVIDDAPVLVTYCPLCASGVVYSRILEGRTLLFGNTSALHESDLVMYDHQTGSYWFQLSGEAIVGELTGKRLTPLPAITTSWGEWKTLHPQTRLLSSLVHGGTRFSSRRYSGDSSVGYKEYLEAGNFAFPVSRDKLDRRLIVSEMVLVAEVGGAARAYPIERLGDAAVNDEIGGQPVVVFSRAGSLSAGVFLATVEEQRLTFRLIEEGEPHYLDEETKSVWDLAGVAVEGPLRGSRLEPLPSRRGFWFAVGLAIPGIDIYLP